MIRIFKQCMGSLCGVALAAALASCGGGGSGGTLSGSGSGSGGSSGGGTTAANVAAMTVTRGPTSMSFNTLFTSVTICVPGTSQCQTIDNIQVDTGSYGLRVLASALTLSLPTQTVPTGGTLLECLGFVDGYVWGPVALGDVKIGGETASNVPLQVMGDSRFPNVPTDCSSQGTQEEDTVDTFLANGILGVGPFLQDCGDACNSTQQEEYYACTSSAASSCSSAATPLAQQVQSVVAEFATDNNGVIIDLPAVSNPAVGALTLTGSLIFGIDTQTNNASGTETVLTTDGFGDITIAFNGQQLTASFIDSGTNGTYFNDSNLPVCTQSDLTDFYCPSTTQNLSATLRGQNGTTAIVPFSIANAYTMVSNNPNFAVFPDVGGTYPSTGSLTFDFGLPFFYGRRVAVGMENATTSAGQGPYFAF